MTLQLEAPMTLLGMGVSWLKAVGRGVESYEKWKEEMTPINWIEEGLEQSGVFSLPYMGFDLIEKGTGVAGYPYNPLREALTFGEYSPKRKRVEDFWGEISPTLGLVSDTAQGLGAMGKWAMGEPVTSGQRRQAFQLAPFSSFPIIKDITQLLNDDHPIQR